MRDRSRWKLDRQPHVHEVWHISLYPKTNQTSDKQVRIKKWRYSKHAMQKLVTELRLEYSYLSYGITVTHTKQIFYKVEFNVPLM